jgi:hypothetical protein
MQYIKIVSNDGIIKITEPKFTIHTNIQKVSNATNHLKINDIRGSLVRRKD